ncbi:MAG TPA: LemA family protein [Prevotella sp.]
MTLLIIFVCAAILLAAIAILFVHISNGLIVRRNRVKQCRSSLCVVLKQRNDLIPNLIASAKTYMGHENEVLTRIAELRSKAFKSDDNEQIAEGNKMTEMLKKFQVSVEQYPKLKADAHFQHLQEQMVDMEDEIQAMRRTYNAAVNDYNNHVEVFPHSIVASMKHHTQEQLIEIPQEELQSINAQKLFDAS